MPKSDALDFVGTHGFCDYGNFDKQDELDDIYSIGACLYFGLFGKIFEPLLAPNSSSGWLEEIERSAYFSRPSKFEDVSAATLRSIITLHLFNAFKGVDIPSEFNLLVCGFGKWSQAFLDVALTLFQLPNVFLKVKVITDERLTFETYLKERPALKDFFSVNGKKLEHESYGSIEFLEGNFFNLIEDSEKYFQSNCAFIALGENIENLNAAKIIIEKFPSYRVNYVWTDDSPPLNLPSVNPVTFAVIADPFIERAAFNVHLLWQKNIAIDFEKTRAEFKQPYNHFSCLLAAVHLFFKMKSVGIDTSAEPDELSATVENFLENPKNESAVNKLTTVEHTRWVIEKITHGFRQRHVYECIDGLNKDKRNKTHTCIVRSSPNNNLEKLSRDQWDDINFHPQNLDELDRMSFNLHRLYNLRVGDLKQTNILTSIELYELRDILAGNVNAITAFNEWLEVISQLWNGNPRNVYCVERLNSDVLDALKNFPVKIRDEATQKFQAFAQKFRMLVESRKYVNYKLEDYKIVNYSPFYFKL